MAAWDGSRGYGSSGDRDKLSEELCPVCGELDSAFHTLDCKGNNETQQESEMDRELVNVGELEQRVKRLEQGTTTTVLPNTDEADEFVRKELVRAYVCMDDRDKPMLEYVIRMFSNPDQWKEFWEENDLDHTYVIGEKI